MGLFTGTSSTSRRPAAAAPLKRRSLGRSRESLTASVNLAQEVQAEAEAAAAAAATSASHAGTLSGGSASLTETVTSNGLHSDPLLRNQSIAQAQHAAAYPPLATTQPSATGRDLHSDEEPELDLADLQSDNAFFYRREGSLDSPLGISPLHPPQPHPLDRIDAYVADHYLDCFGITHRDELVRHHDRLVPFLNKASRFLSIHSLKRKELERDFNEVVDTVDTCPREERCLGRCRLGFNCPTQDLNSAQRFPSRA